MIRSAEDALLGEYKIHGVEFKFLKSHADDRGFFREVIRCSDPFFGTSPSTSTREVASSASNSPGIIESGFAQWSHSKMGRNTVKAWHYHHLQIDWWYCPIGVIHTVLYDNREESVTFRRKIEFKLGDPSLDPDAVVAVVRIPPGVLHGCKVISEEAHLFYITSQTYNPEDEGRFRFDSPLVPHTWAAGAESLTVAANDRRDFIPKNPRVPLQ